MRSQIDLWLRHLEGTTEIVELADAYDWILIRKQSSSLFHSFLVWWCGLPLTNNYPMAERCYKQPREMVLERPVRLDVLSIPGLVFFFFYWNIFSFSPSFLTWQLYLHLANFSLFSFGSSIADSLIHSWPRAPFSPFQQCYCLANYFIVLMHLFLSPLTNSYLTTVSTFSLVCPFQNGEFITRSASIRKVSVEC